MIDLKTIKNKHISVLLNELISSININNNKKNIIIDCTLGIGGHASYIIKKMNKGDIFIGFDIDLQNLKLAEIVLNKINKNVEIFLFNSNFINIKDELKKIGIEKITAVYYDLGLSSLHLDEAKRGFSFMLDGPLDMRLDKTKGKTAANIVNGYSVNELRKIFIEYGEEPMSNKISRKIVEVRKRKKFKTTNNLSEIIPGTNKTKARIFQAIRIEVNNELESIKISLQDAIDLLEKNGKIFVISFHSLEDRITKHIFKKETRNCICSDLICDCNHKRKLKILTKKPILPSNEEIKQNTRSRSAKARCAIKII